MVDLVPRFLHFCAFWGGFALYDYPQTLCGVPKCRKAVMGFVEKAWVIDKLCTGTRHSAVDCQFSVNESKASGARCLSAEAHAKQGCVLIS